MSRIQGMSLAALVLAWPFSATAAGVCPANWLGYTLAVDGSGSSSGWDSNMKFTTITECTPANAGVTAGCDPVASGSRYCLFKGEVNGSRTVTPLPGATDIKDVSAIRFEMRIPESGHWNKKLFFQGGFGADGVVAPAKGKTLGGQKYTALDRGYAVVSMDSGHAGLASLTIAGYTVFGLDQVQRTDYGYRAIGVMTDAAKKLLTSVRAEALDKSYYVGCSNGGRQALNAAKRFYDKFDGVLSGAPAINGVGMLMQAAWDVHQLDPINATPAISTADQKRIGTALRNKCDGLDGVTDGMVSDYKACDAKARQDGFPDELVCKTALQTNCLWPSKAVALKAIMNGPQINGVPVAVKSVWDPAMITTELFGEAAFASWKSWRFQSPGGGRPIATLIGGGMLAQVANNQPVRQPGDFNAAAYLYLLNFPFASTSGYNKLITPTPANAPVAQKYSFAAPSTELNVPTPSDLSAFRDKKGRIIVFTGSGDPAVPVKDITNWYEQLKLNDTTADTYARLYVVPGMAHCGGGPSADVFDLFEVLDNWVPKQVVSAPGSPPEDFVKAIPEQYGYIKATVRSDNESIAEAGISRNASRPLCPYPKIAKYRSGPVDDMHSYACQ
jgi:Tannase and feruloyl esterase